MSAIFIDLSLVVFVAFISFSGVASAKSISPVDAPWRLAEYMASAQSSPKELIATAEKLFAKSTIDASRKDPKLVHAWQDRIAMLSALAHIFDPAEQKSSVDQQFRAAKIIESATLSDPSLLVRDGAVEAMRRINRMRPGYIARWKSTLELAFMQNKNQASGEGYFIRETILSAMREASIRPSAKVLNSARGDTNGRVRARLEEWNTSAF